MHTTENGTSAKSGRFGFRAAFARQLWGRGGKSLPWAGGLCQEVYEVFDQAVLWRVGRPYGEDADGLYGPVGQDVLKVAGSEVGFGKKFGDDRQADAGAAEPVQGMAELQAVWSSPNGLIQPAGP